MNKRERCENRFRRGFTLIELLVVVSIIGLLAAILVPSLAKAREAGRRAVCLSNLHQLGLAFETYLSTWDAYPIGGGDHVDAWRHALFGWGGKTGSLKLKDDEHTKALFIPAAQRPLNGPLGVAAASEPDPLEADEQRVEVRVAQCPSDRGDAPPIRYGENQKFDSVYEAFGTSYALNYQWTAQYCDEVPVQVTRAFPWNEWGDKLFKKQSERNASRFVTLMESPFLTSIHHRRESRGWHGKQARHNALMADGHAAEHRVSDFELTRKPYPYGATWTTYDQNLSPPVAARR